MLIIYCFHSFISFIEIERDSEKSRFDKLYSGFIMVSHVLVVLLIAVVTYAAVPGSSLFSWHPFLMTVAFAGLFTEAILIFNSHSSLLVTKNESAKIRWHLWMQMGGLATVTAGFLVIWVNKEKSNKDHFTTWHGLLGVVAVAYCFLQILAGVTLLLPAKMFSATPLPMHRMKTLHTLSGLALYLTLAVTFFLGLNSAFFVRTVTNQFVYYGCWIAVLLLTAVVGSQSSASLKHRLSYWTSRR